VALNRPCDLGKIDRRDAMHSACFFIGSSCSHFFFATFYFMVSWKTLLFALHACAYFFAPVRTMDEGQSALVGIIPKKN
jgi:hypothetical protein